MAQPAMARQAAVISLHGALSLPDLLSSGQQSAMPAIAAGWAMTISEQGATGSAAAWPDRPTTTPSSRAMRKSDRSTTARCFGAKARSIQFWHRRGSAAFNYPQVVAAEIRFGAFGLAEVNRM